MNPPLVSVLIPCFNNAAFVGEAIESALLQTHPNTEIIVVDDGSIDDSLAQIRSFGSRIRWESGANRGACAARNRALALSTGDYIQFLDADDRLEPEKVSRQIAALCNAAADTVLCQIGLFGDAKGRRKEKKLHPPVTGDPLSYFFDFPIQTAAPLHPRRWLLAVNGFNESLSRAQEFDLHIRLAAAGCHFIMIDEIMVWVRMHDQQRISHRAMPLPEQVAMLTGMAATLDHHQTWTPARRRLIASRLLSVASHSFRAGYADTARNGFSSARAIDPNAAFPESRLLTLLRRWLGDIPTEAFAARVRPLLRR